MRSALAWIAAALPWLLIAGCGSQLADGGETGETGGEASDGEALADIDLDHWCGPVQALAFESRGIGRPMQFGACGHLHVEDGQHRLLHPDGHEESLGSDLATVRLSATGHLVAWGTWHDSVQLRDLRDDAPAWVNGRGVESFGFVRTGEPELGARLWTCGDGGLSLEDPAGSELLSATANCNAIVAAGTRARLLFADAATRGTLTAIDIDTGTRRPTTIDDFEHVFPTGIDERADRLTISHDGRLAVHELVVEVDDGAIGEPVVMGHRLVELANGDVIETCAYPSFLQAAHAGAPLWVTCVDALFHFDGTLARIDGQPRSAQVAAESGALVIELDGVLVRLLPDAPTQPEPIAEPSLSAWSLEVSASADALAFIDDQTLFRWTVARGLEPLGTSVSNQSAGRWRILALADDGRLLAWAQLDGDDQARPYLIDAAGQRTALEPIDGRPNAEGTFADGRVLVRSTNVELGSQSLLILDPTDGSANVIIGPTPMDIANLYMPSNGAIEPRSQLVAASIGYGGGVFYGSQP